MLKVGIIGATGYVGAELLRLLINHPKVKVEAISSVSYEGEEISSIYKNFYGVTNLICENQEEVIKKCAKDNNIALNNTKIVNAINYLAEQSVTTSEVAQLVAEKVNEVLFHAFGTYLLKDKTSFSSINSQKPSEHSNKA